jgi:hypothetical protein
MSAAVLPLVLANCHSAEGDFGKLCEIAGEVERDGTVQSGTKVMVIAERFEDTSPSREVQTTWSAVAAVAPPDKYRVLQAGARESGLRDWSCPALERVFSAGMGASR